MAYATNGDIEIYHETHGETGPGLVFAHGAGGNAAIWWQQIPEFEATHRVVTFDHRGFGRSKCPADQQNAVHFASDLIAVMDAAELETATIVCQSMGGWTGALAAVNHSDRVHSVLLGNTPGAIRNEATLANEEALFNRVRINGGVTQDVFGPGFATRHPTEALAYMQISAFNTESAPNIRDDAAYVTPQQIKDSGVPFWMVSSSHDPLFPPEVLASVAEDIGAPNFRVNGVGHSTYYENPGAFNAILSEFLRTV